MDRKAGGVRQRDGSSDRRWVVLSDDGAISTLGRATDPTKEEVDRVEQSLSASGIGGWLAVQSHSFHFAPPPAYIAVRRLGPEGLTFEDAVAAVRARAGQ